MVEQTRSITRPDDKARPNSYEPQCDYGSSLAYKTRIEPSYVKANSRALRMGTTASVFPRMYLAGLLLCLLSLSAQVAAQTESAPKMIGPPAASGAAPSVSERKFEVGAHFSMLHYEDYGDRLTEPGFGSRLGYNFNDNFAAEVEVDFYPRSHEGDQSVSGRKTLALLGIKAGVRKGRFGFFGKARPGLIYHSRRLDFSCASVDTFEGDCSLSKTNFAFDVGGVTEYYMSPRTFIRFDLGDTIIRSSIIGGYNTTHNLQLNAGIGFRF